MSSKPAVGSTTLHLVRHGDAAPAHVDPERPLTPEGRAAVSRLADWCVAHGVSPHEIRHSGILRAAQTAEILAARLSPAGGVRAVRGLEPDDDARSAAQELVHETASVLLVTHLPFVGELARTLCGRPVHFPTASIASFERDGDRFRMSATWAS
jgi:phosphohistidine phosphatase